MKFKVLEVREKEVLIEYEDGTQDWVLRSQIGELISSGVISQ